jgi:CDP-glucose 4,6-dehydratase
MKKERILITGATGFVGRHLMKRLQDEGYTVIGTSRKDESEFIKKLDIEDFNAVKMFVSKKKITQIIHLAGAAIVEEGQKNPMGTFKTNLISTLHILETARLYELHKVIIASTSHVYGRNKVPYKEIYTPHPTRPYETSKACVDLMAQSYAKSFGLRVLIPRFVNIYGPGDHSAQRLIPKTIKAILSGKSPLMWGGNSKRDYLYIDDAVNAYMVLVRSTEKELKNQYIFNFGTENVISVKELLKTIILLSGIKKEIIDIPDQRAEEIPLQYLSINRAKKVLHWKPQITLDEGLKRTIEWFKYNK